MSAPTYDITIVKGKTFAQAYLYASEKVVFKQITGSPLAAPYRITVPAHGVPDGWPVRIEGAKAPLELNTQQGDYLIATVIDVNTIEFNGLNGSAWKAYTTGGVLVYNEPAPLTGWRARAQVRARVGAPALFSWDSDAGANPDGLITIAGPVLTLNIDAVKAAALDWSTGLYDLEVEKDGEVRQMIAPSTCTVVGEVTV